MDASSKSEKRRKRKALALGLLGLAAFLAWRALALQARLRVETRPPAWDQAIHLEIAWDYRQALAEGRWSDAWHLPPKPGMPPFPPLYHLALMAAYGGGGAEDPSRAAGAALWVNWLYLALLSVSVFALAWESLGEATALAAAFAFACAPEVLSLAQTQLVDLPLTALAAAAYWALARSKGLSRWPGSLALGAAFAAGMMHKWSFFSYMIPAYWVGLRALEDPGRRPKALAGALVALAGFMPWYWAHLPVLPGRLVQAAADAAVPFWKGGAVLTYLMQMPDSLGPPLCLLGLAGLLVALRRREGAWILPAWFLCSWAFWTLVPNRQMRFLLPGLPALAVLAAASLPKPLAWALAGYQLFAAANWQAGWVGPVRVPFVPRHLDFLASDPPVREDWKVAEILREVRRLHPTEAPFSNFTLVANDVRFNGPTFRWTVKAMGLRDIRMRGVNKRLCEFSRFVMLKKGSLGPPTVISGLPEASDTILKPDGWFQRAYKEVVRWPLPDGSAAILYEQRRLKTPPFPATKTAFPDYASGRFSAKGLRIEPGPWNAQASAYRTIRASASEAELRGLKVTDLRLELEGVLAVPAGPDPKARPWEDVRFLKMERLKVRSLKIEAGSLRNFIESRVRGLRVERLELEGGLRVAGRFKGVPIRGEASLELLGSPRNLVIKVQTMRIGPIPLPLWLWPRYRTFAVPLEPNPETPFSIDLPGLTLKDGVLSVP